MADRSCAVMLVNNTPFPLILRGENLDHGNWDVLPPDRIEPKGLGFWKSTSKSWALYGTQGQVDYVIKPQSPPVFLKRKMP